MKKEVAATLILLAFFGGTGHAQFTIIQNPLPDTTGNQRAIAILANFLDNQTTPSTRDQTHGELFDPNATSLASFLKEASYNKLILSGDTVGWFTVNINQTCDLWSIAQAAMAAADSQVDFRNYQRIIVVIPALSSCFWAGIGTVGKVGVQTPDGLVDASISVVKSYSGLRPVVSHEVGHNLGLDHANTWDCGENETLGTSCSSLEYGDPYDTMGNRSWTHFNGASKFRLGWINVDQAQRITQSGIYRIYPLETADNQVKVLRIAGRDPFFNTDIEYYLEYRQSIGYDNGIPGDRPILRGAVVHLANLDRHSNLLDMQLENVAGFTKFQSAALQPGDTYTDAITFNNFSTIGKEGSAPGDPLLVHVEIRNGLPSSDVVDPTVRITSPESNNLARGIVTVAATIGENTGIIKVSLFRIKSAFEHILLAEDTSAPYSFLWNSTSVVDGTHRLTVKAENAAGQRRVSDSPVELVVENTMPAITAVNHFGLMSNRIDIDFYSNVLTLGRLDYGLTASYGFEAPVSQELNQSHSTTLTGLVPSATYHYQIKIENRFNEVVTSEDRIFVTLANPPSPIASEALSSTEVRANWADSGNSSATEYYVERAQDLNFQSDITGSGWVTQTSFIFSGLIPNTRYYFRAKARNSQRVETDFVFLSSAKVFPIPPPEPEPPSLIAANAITPSWSYSGDLGSTQFLVERAADPDFLSDRVDSGWINALEFGFSDLTVNTLYHFRVKAKDSASLETDFVDLPQARTLPVEPAAIAPAFTRIGASRLTVNWVPGLNADPSSLSYAIEMSEQPFPNSDAGNRMAVTPLLSQTFTSLSPDTRYYFRVRANNSSGSSDFIDLGSETTLAHVSQPFAVEARNPTGVSTNAVTVNWGIGENAAEIEYQAQLSLDPDFQSGLTSSSWDTQTGFIFSGLAANTPYYFRVKARNSLNAQSDYVALPGATTLPASPAADGVSFANLESSRLTVNWTSGANPDPSSLSYTVTMSTNFFPNSNTGNASFNTIARSETFTDLSPNASYYFQVKANNASGSSAFTDLGYAVTLANAPRPEPISFVSDNAIAVRWSDENPQGTEYLVEGAADPNFVNRFSSDWITETSFGFDDLPSNTLCYFRVKARNSVDAETEFVALANARTLPTVPWPDSPAFTRVGSSRLTVNWSLGSNPNPSDLFYTIVMSKLPFPNNDPANVSLNTTVRSEVFTGLVSHTRYYFQVKANNTSGSSEFMNLGSMMTMSSLPAPLPSEIKSSSGTAVNSTTLRWGSGGNASDVFYRAERSLDPDFRSGVAVSPWDRQMSFTFDGLDANRLYYFRVKSRNIDEVETLGQTQPISTLSEAVLSATSTLGATYDSLTVQWTPIASAEGYLLEASRSSDFSTALITK
ncbi:MAG: fibronectin type III domain-containing protein, partial [Elusimicrobia bacterium]|nr:fibronectin type III domain-containing protein [Elusimicrobiota bacterium]